jgi:4-alpha-glucanotransferase
MNEVHMAGDAELDRLAERLGIETWYHDIWGNRQTIPERTRRDLAQAMGYPADDPAQVAESLRRIDEASWRRITGPVAILDEHGYAAVEVVLPEAAARVEWRIRLEDGREIEGGTAIDAMERLEHRRLDGRSLLRWRLPLPGGLPLGYHGLWLAAGGEEGEASLIVAPRRCLTPEDLAPGRRIWGFGIQLYALRSGTDWGIGDFGTLGAFAGTTAELGADAVGLNPLHALFPDDPGHFSPYSPSNRAFLNVLYLDMGELAAGGRAGELARDPDFLRRLEAARGAEMVDYTAVAALKLPVLEAAFADFQASGSDRDAFDRFRAREGEPLEMQALFDALHEHFYRNEGRWDWHDWPETHRRPDTPEVRAFARQAADRVTFHAWLQFHADRQLGQAAARARDAGMALGFYRDLAVANHPGGAAAWSNPGVVLSGASVGAPPDLFSPQGQNWGLSPLSPVGLLEQAYRPFIEGLRANMRHAGALRIDHAMALRHLYWIPNRPGHEGGAYVRYPERDLMRLIALESRRNRCAVVGEALGTVPEGFPEALRDAGIQSYRVLYFERRRDDAFKRPPEYPEDGLVTVTTHDLPTLRGWWTGHDQDLRRRLGLFVDDEGFARERADRMADRERLFEALRDAGCLPAGAQIPEMLSTEHVAAVHRYLAQTPGRILMVQIEDALGEVEQPNLPGTTTQHPNWQRKLPATLDRLAADPGVRAVADAVREVRPSPRGTAPRPSSTVSRG